MLIYHESTCGSPGEVGMSPCITGSLCAAVNWVWIQTNVKRQYQLQPKVCGAVGEH